MGVMSEFRDFAMRGNVVDLAVGVIIGGAFGKIVSALVDKLMMQGHEVTVLDNFFTGQKKNIAHWLHHPNFK